MLKTWLIILPVMLSLISCQTFSQKPEMQSSGYDNQVITFVFSENIIGDPVCRNPGSWVRQRPEDCQKAQTFAGRKARIGGLTRKPGQEQCLKLSFVDDNSEYYYCGSVEMDWAIMLPEDNPTMVFETPKDSFIGKDIWTNSNMMRYQQDIVPVNKSDFKGLEEKGSGIVKLHVVSGASTLMLGYGDLKKFDWFKVLVKNENNEKGLIFSDSKRFFDHYPIKKDWDKKVLESIKKGTIYMGMPKDAVLLSWGPPKKVNSSVYSWGTEEQWVYEANYVYLKNGIVSSWQAEN